MGIHNESGVSRKNAPPMSELVHRLLTSITETENEDYSFVPFASKLCSSYLGLIILRPEADDYLIEDGKDEAVLLVNNLGGMTELEMGAICGESVTWLRNKGIKPVRVLKGTYMVKP